MDERKDEGHIPRAVRSPSHVRLQSCFLRLGFFSATLVVIFRTAQSRAKSGAKCYIFYYMGEVSLCGIMLCCNPRSTGPHVLVPSTPRDKGHAALKKMTSLTVARGYRPITCLFKPTRMWHLFHDVHLSFSVLSIGSLPRLLCQSLVAHLYRRLAYCYVDSTTR